MYLLEISNGKININARNNRAFIFSCKHNHINIVKYLLSISNIINIYANDNLAFSIAISNNSIVIINFILEYSKNNNNPTGDNGTKYNLLYFIEVDLKYSYEK
jgi:ankyrin repeat protein